ncbi:MAG: hypothetical protein ABI632_12810 [Pseudolysinimonas sp.]
MEFLDDDNEKHVFEIPPGGEVDIPDKYDSAVQHKVGSSLIGHTSLIKVGSEDDKSEETVPVRRSERPQSVAAEELAVMKRDAEVADRNARIRAEDVVRAEERLKQEATSVADARRHGEDVPADQVGKGFRDPKVTTNTTSPTAGPLRGIDPVTGEELDLDPNTNPNSTSDAAKAAAHETPLHTTGYDAREIAGEGPDFKSHPEREDNLKEAEENEKRREKNHKGEVGHAGGPKHAHAPESESKDAEKAEKASTAHKAESQAKHDTSKHKGK